MKPIIQLSFPSGHVYVAASQVIAENRAKTMLELHPDEFPDLASAMTDTVELFDDSDQIRDWGLNQMNFGELNAELVRYTPPEINAQEAEWDYIDHPPVMGELDGETLLRQPTELTLRTMAASRQMCNVTALNDADGRAYAAVVLVIGSESVIGTYINAMKTVTDHLMTPLNPAATGN